MESRESIFNDLVSAYKYALYYVMLGRGETEDAYLKAAGEAEQYRKRWENASGGEDKIARIVETARRLVYTKLGADDTTWSVSAKDLDDLEDLFDELDGRED